MLQTLPSDRLSTQLSRFPPLQVWGAPAHSTITTAHGVFFLFRLIKKPFLDWKESAFTRTDIGIPFTPNSRPVPSTTQHHVPDGLILKRLPVCPWYGCVTIPYRKRNFQLKSSTTEKRSIQKIHEEIKNYICQWKIRPSFILYKINRFLRQWGGVCWVLILFVKSRAFWCYLLLISQLCPRTYFCHGSFVCLAPRFPRLVYVV